MNQDIKKIILKNSISLNNIGSFNFAYKKNDALLLINELKKLNIAIIGGDVLYKSGDRYQYSYGDNWSVSKNSDMKIQSNIDASYDQSIIYILGYETSKIQNDTDIVFELTLKIANWKELFGDMFSIDNVGK